MTYSFSFGKTLAAGLLAFAVSAPLAASAQDDVQSQAELTARVEKHAPAKELYIKDRPILGWKITGDTLADLPEAIRDPLGSVDSTSYDDAYIAKNIGSVVALQMSKTGPDFYVIGKETFTSKYEMVGLEEVAAKNTRLVKRLDMAPEVLALFNAKDAGLTGALKTVPVEMVRMSAIGYAPAAEVIIQSPWGTQTKPADQDGFLVFDSGENQYYMVNQGANGNPSSYVPAK
ncbi:hypothetical protein PsAD46_01710 [Pseudovibrio sp. Ad46]|uniref:hypothetical protein n=1 Tax=Pseudovibrio sp. Ad46 TaxID=989432 RepID=UPI0007AE715F|nr:hypothetical protein [Pseudovibrio sp. Ad46]KZK91485.1 hypothetical protein PsAD46_01710 [Pseudovibrio sp. Ad46]